MTPWAISRERGKIFSLGPRAGQLWVLKLMKPGSQWRRNHCHACFLAGLNRPWHCHRQAALLRFWLNPVSDSDSSACHRDRDGSGLTRSGNLNLVSQPLRLAARLRASRTEKRKVTHGTGIAEHRCLDLGEILVPGRQRRKWQGNTVTAGAVTVAGARAAAARAMELAGLVHNTSNKTVF